MTKLTVNHHHANATGVRNFKKLLYVTVGVALMLPMAAQADPLAYVVQETTNSISVIDTQTNTIVKTISGVGNNNLVSIDFTQDGSLAYITDQFSHRVIIIDGATDTVAGSIFVGLRPSDVEFTLDDEFAYVTNYGSNTVSVIDTATNSVAATIPVGSQPFGVEFTPDGNFAYVANENSSISVIDIATQTVVDTITVAGRPRHVTITPDGNFAYVTNFVTNFVTVIDTATHAVVTTIPVGGTSRDIEITADGAFAYVMGGNTLDIKVIDIATNTITATIPTHSPFGLKFTPDGSLAYVSSIFTATVSVIDTATNTVIEVIPVAPRPRDIAFKPDASNEKPTAAAGLDQAIRAGDTVSLDGSASFDDNTGSVDLGYNWSFSNQPVGSTAILTDAMTATPSFTADLAGTYDIALIVTDEGGLDSDADNVSVSSDNLAPTADAGDGQLVVLGSNVYLDGSGSNDPENDPLTYGWALTAPAGSTAALSDPASATPVFSTDVEGTYSVQLTVSDFLGAGTPDTTEIVAASNGDYALSKIMDANAYVLGLSDAEFTKKGNRKAFGKLLRKAVSEIQKGKTSSAIKKLEKAIERTDGCALNGTPDTDKKRDWITNCAAQDVVYACLTDALDALNSDAAGTGQGKPKKEKKAKKPKKAKKVKN
ncbi:MAG: PKD domain-containing protein [Litorimonas sp.]